MSVSLTIRDQSLDHRGAREWLLDVLTERLTVRELIRNRIDQEVDHYNTGRPHTYRGLIQPSRQSSRGERQAHRRIDKQKQVASACDAFEGGRLVILIGDAQANALDDEFSVRPDTAVTFLRLSVIVGG